MSSKRGALKSRNNSAILCVSRKGNKPTTRRGNSNLYIYFFPVCFVYPWPFRLSPAATSADLPLGFLTCSRPANVYYNYVSVDSIQLPQLFIVPCCSLGHRLGSFGLFVTSLVTSQSRLLTTKATSNITDRVFRFAQTPCEWETLKSISDLKSHLRFWKEADDNLLFLADVLIAWSSTYFWFTL